VPNFLLEVPEPNIAVEDLDEALADIAAYSLVRRNSEKQGYHCPSPRAGRDEA